MANTVHRSDHTEWIEVNDDTDEWAELEKDIINFLNSDFSPECSSNTTYPDQATDDEWTPLNQDIMNSLGSGFGNNQELQNPVQVSNLSAGSGDPDGPAADQETNSNENEQPNMISRFSGDYNADWLEDWAGPRFSQAEAILGSPWTFFDSMRVVRRVNQEIDDRAGGYTFVWNGTGREFEIILCRAVEQGIEHLSTHDDLWWDLAEDQQCILFFGILFKIRNSVVPWGSFLSGLFNREEENSAQVRQNLPGLVLVSGAGASLDEERATFNNIFSDYNTEVLRPLVNEYLQETTFASAIESVLGRAWTLDDSARVLCRITHPEIENQGDGFGARLCVAIDQDIEHLRDESPNLTEEDRTILFLGILQRLENLAYRDRISGILRPMINRNVSTDQRGGGLSEERMSKYLKTRSCDEGSRGRDGKQETEICPVCLDQLYHENETIGILGCGHEYHADCIKQWLKRKIICPLCKAAVQPVDEE